MKYEENKFSRHLTEYSFLLGLVVIPLFWWPWAKVAYELPKVWLVNRWVELLGIAGLIAAAKGVELKKIKIKLILPVLAFLSIAAVSSIVGIDPFKSLWGNYFRSDGLFTLFHLMGLFFFVSLFYQKQWEKSAALAIAAGSVITSAWAILGQVGAGFGQPNFLVGYLLVTFPILFSILDKAKRHKFLWFMAIILQAIAVFFTEARIGVIGLMTIAYWRIANYFARLKPLIYGLGTIILGLIVVYAVWKQQLYLPWDLRPEFVPEGRERIIKSIARGVWRRPILGWGWANADYAFENNPWPSKFDLDVYVDKAHGMFLEVLATTGIAGFVVYLAIVLLAVINSRRTLWLGPMVIYLIHSQTNIISIAEEMLFWVMLGIAAGGTEQNDKIEHGV